MGELRRAKNERSPTLSRWRPARRTIWKISRRGARSRKRTKVNSDAQTPSTYPWVPRDTNAAALRAPGTAAPEGLFSSGHHRSRGQASARLGAAWSPPQILEDPLDARRGPAVPGGALRHHCCCGRNRVAQHHAHSGPPRAPPPGASARENDIVPRSSRASVCGLPARDGGRRTTGVSRRRVVMGAAAADWVKSGSEASRSCPRYPLRRSTAAPPQLRGRTQLRSSGPAGRSTPQAPRC